MREDESRFYATEINILTGQTMLERVRRRLNKTPEEIRENLFDLKVEVKRSPQPQQAPRPSPRTVSTLIA